MWWQLDHPEWAIITIALIDLLGFLPTFRKTWHDPTSESFFAWVLFLLGNIAALLALTTYSIMTSFYIVTMIVASAALAGIVLLRKKPF
jgi:glucose uptake protein GlcU